MIKKFTIFLIFNIIFVKNLFAQTAWDYDPSFVRQYINSKIMNIVAETPSVHYVVNHEINREDRTTPVRVYIPSVKKNLPIILMIHGGGWVAGNLDTHDNLARYLCAQVEAIVVSVGYKNSPEGKFPLPLEQCYDALLWISLNATEYQGDVSNLAIVGDSAGGNMAAALCLMNRDRNGPRISLQVLINPSPDLTCNGTLKKQGDALDNLRWFATQYVINQDEVLHPYVSPILGELFHLPTSLIILAEKDELYQSGFDYAKNLSDSGVVTNVFTQMGIGHLAGDGARASLKAQEALKVAVLALREALK